MNKRDVAQVLMIINANFSGAYAPTNQTEKELLVESWLHILGRYERPVVEKALFEVISHASYAPRIGDIVKKIEEIEEAGKPSAEAMWAELKQTLRKAEKYAYGLRLSGSKDDCIRMLNRLYNGMSGENKAYCPNLSAFVDMTAWDMGEYEKARYMKRIPEIRKKIRITASVPVMITAEGEVKRVE